MESALKSLPPAVRQFYEYASSMGFSQKPDYDKWIRVLDAAAAEEEKASKKALSNKGTSENISVNNNQ